LFRGGRGEGANGRARDFFRASRSALRRGDPELEFFEPEKPTPFTKAHYHLSEGRGLLGGGRRKKITFEKRSRDGPLPENPSRDEERKVERSVRSEFGGGDQKRAYYLKV